MKIFVVETTMDDLKGRFLNLWTVRRAVVITHSDEYAAYLVKMGIDGEEVFSSAGDRALFSRPRDKPAFDVDACQVFQIGDTGPADKGVSRIIAWELAPPAGKPVTGQAGQEDVEPFDDGLEP